MTYKEFPSCSPFLPLPSPASCPEHRCWAEPEPAEGHPDERSLPYISHTPPAAAPCMAMDEPPPFSCSWVPTAQLRIGGESIPTVVGTGSTDCRAWGWRQMLWHLLASH